LSASADFVVAQSGITAVTAYSPTLLSQAGYSSIKQAGLAGGLNTIGIVGASILSQRCATRPKLALLFSQGPSSPPKSSTALAAASA